MTIRPILLGALLAPSLAAAQMIMPPPATAKARDQIEQVRKAASGFATQDRAAAGGFHPVLNWLPTMGTHWINPPRQSDGHAIDIMAPDQLMFSPMSGKEALVG